MKYIKPHSKGNGRTVVPHHQKARRPVQQRHLHDDKVARIELEGHCAHYRMIWFLLLSLGAEEADRWVLASTTWFLSVYVSMARYTSQWQWDGCGPCRYLLPSVLRNNLSSRIVGWDRLLWNSMVQVTQRFRQVRATSCVIPYVLCGSLYCLRCWWCFEGVPAVAIC